MNRLETEYTVWFQMDGWGTSSVKVRAVDIQEAIKKVIEPILEKFGEREIFIVRVV